MKSHEFDVFVSYRHVEPDKSWVHDVLVPRLDSGGLRVCLDGRSFRPGFPIVMEMERAVGASRYTLAVVTTAYTMSHFTELECVLADRLGLEQVAQRLIVVIREPAETAWEMQARDYWPMVDDEKFESAAADLCARLRLDPDA
jgi:TIR domain